MRKTNHFIVLSVASITVSSAFAQSHVKFQGFEVFADPAEVVVKEVCRPEYPRSSIKNSEVGTVGLSLFVSASGIVTRTKLIATSGFRELDRAAMEGLIGCKFQPAQKDGVATEGWVPFRYEWKID